MDITLVESAGALEAIAARAARADRLAVDAEANGLHAFRPALCVLQLAWPEGSTMAVAVIDTLAVPVTPLAPLLGEGGPVKVLHDLTFDARLLADAGAPLARARDTSVAARLLGFAATGLSALLASELGVAHAKDLQQHDWSRRPITPAQLAYLAGDVGHLLALDDHLDARGAALDIRAEIAAECAYKLSTALNPPRDGRPAYARIKGVGALDGTGRAVLRRLCEAREAAASAVDVPPFKVITNETLLELAVKRPRDRAALAAVRGATVGLAGQRVEGWLRAVAAGIDDGDIPPADQAMFAPVIPDRVSFAKRRAREAQVSAWRKAEATRRGVDAQVVLPGHCATDLVDALIAHDDRPDADALQAAIAGIPGLGSSRIDRYSGALQALAAVAPERNA